MSLRVSSHRWITSVSRRCCSRILCPRLKRRNTFKFVKHVGTCVKCAIYTGKVMLINFIRGLSLRVIEFGGRMMIDFIMRSVTKTLTSLYMLLIAHLNVTTSHICQVEWTNGRATHGYSIYICYSNIGKGSHNDVIRFFLCLSTQHWWYEPAVVIRTMFSVFSFACSGSALDITICLTEFCNEFIFRKFRPYFILCIVKVCNLHYRSSCLFSIWSRDLARHVCTVTTYWMGMQWCIMMQAWLRDDTASSRIAWWSS